MEKVHVFIDEFGNASLNLDKKGTFSHFVYAAVLVTDQNLEQAQKIRKSLSQTFAKGNPFKSKNLDKGTNDIKERLLALTMFRELDCLVTVLVVDKSKLDSKGFKYRQSFYKFFQKTFLNTITKNSNAYEIHLDRLGWPEFQKSLKEYIDTQVFNPNIFDAPKSFKLVEDTQEEPLMQLADLIAGSVGKAYCVSHSVERGSEIMELLHDKMIIEFYPTQYVTYTDSSNYSSEEDRYVKNIALDGAKEAYANRGNLTNESIAVLDYLVMMFLTNPSRLISTYEIKNKLQLIYPTFSDQDLYLCIRRLRDKGVLISSLKGKSGYKLPNCVKDVTGFYEKYLDTIIPSINRVAICNSKLKINSINKINLLSNPGELSVLNDLIKVVANHKNMVKPELFQSSAETVFTT